MARKKIDIESEPCIKVRKGKKGVRYYVNIRLAGRPAVSGAFDTPSEAIKFRDKVKADSDDRAGFMRYVKDRTTIRDLIDRYLSEVEVGSSQRHILKWWIKRIGDRHVSSVTSMEIAAIRKELAEGKLHRRVLTEDGEYLPPATRKPATVNRHLAHLSHVFTVAIKEWGHNGENPLKKVARLTEPRARIRYLTDDERSDLLEACKDSREPLLHEFVLAALLTGARAGELVGLLWSDIDFERGIATLRNTKNGERRLIPISGDLNTRLRARRGIGNVFTSKAGNPFTNYSKAFAIARKKARIKNFRFHDLRHTAASMLVQNGATLVEVGHLLGHKSAQMTLKYAHLNDDNVKGLGDKLMQIYGLDGK